MRSGWELEKDRRSCAEDGNCGEGIAFSARDASRQGRQRQKGQAGPPLPPAPAGSFLRRAGTPRLCHGRGSKPGPGIPAFLQGCSRILLRGQRALPGPGGGERAGGSWGDSHLHRDITAHPWDKPRCPGITSLIPGISPRCPWQSPHLRDNPAPPPGFRWEIMLVTRQCFGFC